MLELYALSPQTWIIASLLVFILGLLIGSFLNVCIYRIPLEKTIVRGRSYCPSCGALIRWYQNLPVISYLVQGGRCASCKTRISLIYPIVELLTGLVFLAVFLITGPTVDFLILSAMSAALIVISGIDLAYKIIPDGLVLFLIGLGVIQLFYQVFAQDAKWYVYVIGFFAASVPLLLLGMLYPDGMGGGDIKLMAAAGLILGFQMILLALFLGAVYAAFYSLFLILSRKGTLKSEIPFGPYLSAGIFTAALWGNDVLRWYFSIFV